MIMGGGGGGDSTRMLVLPADKGRATVLMNTDDYADDRSSVRHQLVNTLISINTTSISCKMIMFYLDNSYYFSLCWHDRQL